MEWEQEIKQNDSETQLWLLLLLELQLMLLFHELLEEEEQL